MISVSLYYYELFFEKKAKKLKCFVTSTCCICIALSFYESFALTLIMGWAIISVVRMADHSISISEHLEGAGFIGTSLIISILFRSLICRLLSKIFLIELSMRNPSKTLLLSIIPKIKTILYSVIDKYIVKINCTYVLIFDVSLFVIFVYILFLTLKKKNILFIFYWIVMLFGLFGLVFFEGGLPERSTQSMNLFVAFAMKNLFDFCTRVIKHRWARIFGISVVLVLLWNNCCYMNVFYNGEVKNYQKNIRAICNIGDDINRLGYSNKVICVVGKPEIIENRLYSGNDINYPKGIDTIPWNTEGGKPLQSLFYYCGYNFCFGKTQWNDDYSLMPTYPEDGYILDRGDYIVVKIGEN